MQHLAGPCFDRPSTDRYDDIVIGGGFFGCAIAADLAKRGRRVLLLERQADLLTRASYVNQARVHSGYHYPRAVLTASRSRFNFARFIEEYPSCIDKSFQMYYAIGRHHSKVSARQFARFCHTIGAPIQPAPPSVCRLFRNQAVEDVFAVQEYAFDADALRMTLCKKLAALGVEVCCNAEANFVRPVGSRPGLNNLQWTSRAHGETNCLTAAQIYLCTYSRINRFLRASSLPLLPLKHELVEISLIEVPDELRSLGITIMCGPFFGTMPFPPRHVHSLYHVRYAVHYFWNEAETPAEYPSRATLTEVDEQIDLRRRPSNFPAVIRDAERYVPVLRRSRYVDSLWDLRTVLPRSEESDSRPILFERNWGLTGFHCVSGAKIDNIYDLLDRLSVV